MSDREARLRAGIAAIWQKALPTVRTQIERLEAMSAALEAGELSDDARRAAERDAHQIAGAAGSFGFPQATTAGRELEVLLADGSNDAQRAKELVAFLRTTLLAEPQPTTES